MRILPTFAAVGLLALQAGCPGSSANAPQAEVVDTDVKLDLPSAPEFKTPQPHPDGTHAVLEMRRLGAKFLNQDIKVKGYVVWKYDCIAEIGEQVYKDSPEKCQKPHFLLGDAPDTAREKAVEVVDVPRPPRADEKKYLPKEDIKNWPEVPVYEAGQFVIVEGKWAQQSPLGFVNTDGLLVYTKLYPGDSVEGAAPVTPTEGAAPPPPGTKPAPKH